MSYEGFTQYLCARGHESSFDCYEEHAANCPHCGAEFRWQHDVDITNGIDINDRGTFAVELEQLEETKFEDKLSKVLAVCSKHGASLPAAAAQELADLLKETVIEVPRYKIPLDVGTILV